MDIGALLLDILLSSLDILWKIAYIMIPLIVLVEVLKDSGLLEKISQKCRWFTRLFRLPEQISFGVIIGVFVGLLYGSGIISRLLEDVHLTRKQLNTLFILVSICHAVFEETALYLAGGANAFLILGFRLVIGIGFALCYAHLFTHKDSALEIHDANAPEEIKS